MLFAICVIPGYLQYCKVHYGLQLIIHNITPLIGIVFVLMLTVQRSGRINPGLPLLST